jgi:hypothetical protein
MRYSPVIAALLFCVPCVAAASGTFDGKYVGRITNVKQASLCGKADSWGGSFTVAADKFQTDIGGGKLPLSGDVHFDGSFEASSTMSGGNDVRLAGKIEGVALHATATNSRCTWNFDMKKAGT